MGGRTPAVLRALLKAGADPNAVDKRGETALMQALSPYVHDYSHPEVVKVLLEAGADPNAVDHNGVTTLMLAMGQWWHTKDSDDIVVRNVQLLLEAGAEVNAVDKHGGTALMAATDAGSVEAVKTLLAAGADVNRATSAQSGARVSLHAIRLLVRGLHRPLAGRLRRQHGHGQNPAGCWGKPECGGRHSRSEWNHRVDAGHYGR